MDSPGEPAGEAHLLARMAMEPPMNEPPPRPEPQELLVRRMPHADTIELCLWIANALSVMVFVYSLALHCS